MKQFLGLIMLVAGTGISYGQHTEFSLQAGSGLFSFGGPGAVRETGLNINDVSSFPVYLDNVYGRNSGFSYGLTTQAQRVTNKRLIYGGQIGYESLTSRVSVTTVSGGFSPTVTVNGRATLQSGYLNVNPFVGKRFGNDRIGFDLVVGTDVGITLSGQERGSLTQTGELRPLSNLYRSIPTVDFRPRLNLTGYYRSFGLSVGYSHGLTNYAVGTVNAAAYSRMWRVGVVYRLVKRA